MGCLKNIDKQQILNKRSKFIAALIENKGELLAQCLLLLENRDLFDKPTWDSLQKIFYYLDNSLQPPFKGKAKEKLAQLKELLVLLPPKQQANEVKSELIKKPDTLSVQLPVDKSSNKLIQQLPLAEDATASCPMHFLVSPPEIQTTSSCPSSFFYYNKPAAFTWQASENFSLFAMPIEEQTILCGGRAEQLAEPIYLGK
jgi:hypothetical protein